MTLPGEETLCKSSDAGPCIFCQSLVAIDSEISKATEMVKSLLEQRKELDRKLGRLCHKSLIHRMPPEIISYIFEMYVKDWRVTKSNRYGPLLLGAICRPWRQLAWKKADLWTSLKFRFGPQVSFNSFHLAHDWLGRSGELLPLSIRLHQSKNVDHFPLVCHAFAQTILSKYISRCYSLVLTLPSATLASIDCISNPGPSMLQTLDVSCTDSESADGILLNLGPHVSPRTVTLKHIILSEVAIDFNNLTSFSGDHMFLGELVQILKMAPTLKICSQRGLFHDVIRWMSPLVMEPLIHSDLEVFDVDFCCETRDLIRFFERVAFPRLKSFICIFCGDYFPVETFTEFIGRSSCSLQQLSLKHMPISGQGLIDIAKAAPSITDLSISCLLAPPTAPSFSSFYQALYIQRPHKVAFCDGPDEPLLPKLQKLYINPGSERFVWEFLPGFFGAFSLEENALMRPLKEVEISCVDSYPLNSQEFNFYGIPFIQRDILQDILLLEDVDLKLHYRTNENASPRDIIDASWRFHESIDMAREYGPDMLTQLIWRMILHKPNNHSAISNSV